VETTFALGAGASSGEDPIALAALQPSVPGVAPRGVGEIFQALFRRPFGPVALAAWREARAAAPEPELAVAGTGEPFAEERPMHRPTAPASATATSIAIRAGSALPVIGAPVADPGLDLSVAAARDFHSFFAGELEVGYFDASGLRRGFLYPGVTYVNQGPADATVRYQAVPVLLSARLQLPTGPVRPYLLLGGGVGILTVSADPHDLNPTLRATRYVGEVHGGVGFSLDLSDRVFGALEGRFFSMSDARAFGHKFQVAGLRAGLQLGIRL
jgi:hypothetical protein